MYPSMKAVFQASSEEPQDTVKISQKQTGEAPHSPIYDRQQVERDILISDFRGFISAYVGVCMCECVCVFNVLHRFSSTGEKGSYIDKEKHISKPIIQGL